MIRSKNKLALFAMTAGLMASTSHAVLTWPGCTDVASTDFKSVTIASRATDTLAEPMKMAFDLLASPGEDAKGKVDVYFTERMGKIRKFDSKTSKVITLATLSLNVDQANSSDGALGIVLDPAFKTNNYVYIYYTYNASAEKSWRISRFTLNAAHASLDLGSEVVVLKVPIVPGSKHPGGAMQFDSYGDLWISTGNDYKETGTAYPLFSSPNTNDLRGKILRIHPTPDGKYTVPDGNLFAPGTASTKPEIYIMGNRNPYTLSLDPVRRWLVWGEVGPDFVDMNGAPMNMGGPEKTEEYDLAKAPGNYGYPFFSGDYATLPGTNPNAPAIPANVNWEDAQPGLMVLPPAISPIYAYKKSCAITGPIYRYDGALNSSIKFPPHFTRKWLVTDFNGDGNKITAFTLSDDGTKITSQEQVIASVPLHGPLQMETGPDGALYVNNYAGYRTSVSTTSLIRIEYTGTCHPATPTLETTVSVASRNSPYHMGPAFAVSQARDVIVDLTTYGAFKLEVRDILGRPLAFRSGQGAARLTLGEIQKPGVYFISVTSPEGQTTRKLVRE